VRTGTKETDTRISHQLRQDKTQIAMRCHTVTPDHNLAENNPLRHDMKEGTVFAKHHLFEKFDVVTIPENRLL